MKHMRTKILWVSILVLLFAGCRRKTTDNYEYYKPYQKDTTQTEIADEQPASDTVHVVAEVNEMPIVKGVDLNDRFFIVVASYSIEEYAKAQKRELEAQGFKPEVFMLNSDGWYKLAVESHQNIDDARSALSRLKKKDGIFATAVIVQK
jgi:cell division protein FtsN